MGSFICSRRLAVTVIFTLIMAVLLVTSSSHPSPPVQAYNPQIAVSPEQGPAGTQVTVTGTGWEEHASRGISVPIEIGFANEVARGVPDATGKFSASLTIPPEAAVGELRISAIIGNGGAADAIFTVSPPVTGEYSVTVEQAWTLDADGKVKTIFHPGDPISYSLGVRNTGQSADAYFTWRAKYNDPQIGVNIFSQAAIWAVQTGYYGYSAAGTIPSDAAGTYLNWITLVVGTDKFVKESRFEIAGGEACMFNAPDFSLDSNQIGHVGWGFKTGLGDEWEYGATEGTGTADNWIKKGTRAAMLAEFGSRPHYTRYTCRPWPWIWSNPSAADKEARDGQARPYDAYRDNDLSRAVAVLNHTYGAGMPYLDLVEFLNANYYFESLPTETEGGAPTRWTPIMLLNPGTEGTPSDLSITTAPPQAVVEDGGTLTYKITVTNNGPGAATGVQVTDALPNGFIPIALEPEGSCQIARRIALQRIIECDLRNMAVHGTTQVLIGGMMVTTQSLTNQVEVKADQIDPDLGNNKAEVITDPPPLANPVVTLHDFLGSKDFAEFVKLVNTTYDTGLCILDSWIVVAPVVLTKGTLKQTFPPPPDMAQHCAGAFPPIIDLLMADQ